LKTFAGMTKNPPVVVSFTERVNAKDNLNCHVNLDVWKFWLIRGIQIRINYIGNIPRRLTRELKFAIDDFPRTHVLLSVIRELLQELTYEEFEACIKIGNARL